MRGMPWRDQTATVIITAVVTLFGVILIQASGTLSLLAEAAGASESSSISIALRSVSWVFIGLACYTAAIVTANVFTTLVAGRVRVIAQYRLLGASSRKLRGWLALEGLGAALAGGTAGFAAGIGLSWLAVRRLVDDGSLPPLDYPLVQPDAFVPLLLGVLTVVIAAWAGSRRVARVSPVQALSASIEAPAERGRVGFARKVLAWLFLVPGLILLAIGIAVGLATPMGVMIAFLGGVGSFSAIMIGAPAFIPALLRATGRAFGTSVPARLARENAVRQPRQATRGTIGMIIGVTLVVMFIIATESFRTQTNKYLRELGTTEVPPEAIEAVNAVLSALSAIAVSLTAVSGVLAAIGMIANLSLQVMQRRRELGLLRAVGATAGQLRASITLEASLMSIVAIGTGTVLGIFYGWAGAQSALGAVERQLFWPTVPWQLLVVVMLACVALAAVSSIGPAIRSMRTSPLEALRIA